MLSQNGNLKDCQIKTFPPSFTTNKSISTKLVWYNCKIKLRFEGMCLNQEDKVAFTPKNMVNPFIVYELNYGHEI